METNLTLAALAKTIDHSLLHPALSDAEIDAGLHLAAQYRVAAACVKPYAVTAARRALEGTGVAVCAVAAFPHGNSTVSGKAAEIAAAADDGATEIDAVVNVAKVLSGDWEYVSREIAACQQAAVSGGAILKVIFENDFLEDGHIIRLCELCSESAVAFVKTSTGYGFVRQADGRYAYRGATEHQVRLMRSRCPLSVGVKAAGGIRTLDEVLRFLEAGAARIGASATKGILEEAKKRGYR